MTKLKITMHGAGGELDSQSVEGINEDQALDQAKLALLEMIGLAVLSPGDRFTIEEL
jgi:hypothetical protein